MKEYVQHIIDYIEDHIEEPITMGSITKHIGYSRFYLHKMFPLYTGYPIISFVRRRKLEYAMDLLKGDTPLVDIATQYGFSSRRSFSRAFNEQYGKYPSAYRNNNHVLSKPLKIYELGGIKMLPYLTDIKEIELPEMHVVSHTIFSTNPEDEVIAFMEQYAQKHKLEVRKTFGNDVPVPEDRHAPGVRGYETLIVVSQEQYEAHKPDGIKKYIIQPSKYVTLTIKEPFKQPFERIPNGWKKLVSVFENEYVFNKDAKSCGLEEVVESDGKLIMNLFIPIK